MKVVESAQRAIEMGNVGETVKFSIAASGKIIRNVIASIYSDREKTVVRELIANAIDAHAASGVTDRRISVKMPTMLDPQFVVRDYGEGMSHDFVMRLYSAIGYSTKDSSNEQTGMFGVGSKSPLSICDTFTVRCFDAAENRVRMYTVAVTDDDVPQISHTFDVKPREADQVHLGGVEVCVPVSSYDIDLFVSGAQQQYFCWFDKPVDFSSTVSVNPYRDITPLAPSMYIGIPTDKDKLRDKTWAVYARQGAAVYPVSQNKVYSLLSSGTLTLLQKLSRRGYDVLIDIPLGTVDVTMAREHIQYNETSTNNLVQKIEENAAFVVQTLVNAVGDAKSMPKALERIFQHFRALDKEADNTAAIKLKQRESVVWALSYVKDAVRANYDNSVPAYKRYFAAPALKEEANCKTLLGEYSTSSFREMTMVHGSNKKLNAFVPSDRKEQIDIVPNSVMIVIPMGFVHFAARVEEYLQENFHDEVGTEAIKTYLWRVARKEYPEAVKAARRFGNVVKLLVAEDFPEYKSERKASTRKARGIEEVLVYNFLNQEFDPVAVKADYNVPALYVTLHNRKEYLGFNGKVLTEYALNSLIRQMKSVGLELPIYRLSAAQTARALKKGAVWKPLVECATEKYQELYAKYGELYEIKRVLSNCGDYYVGAFLAQMETAKRSADKINIEDFIFNQSATDRTFDTFLRVAPLIDNRATFGGIERNTEYAFVNNMYLTFYTSKDITEQEQAMIDELSRLTKAAIKSYTDIFDTVCRYHISNPTFVNAMLEGVAFSPIAGEQIILSDYTKETLDKVQSLVDTLKQTN